MPKRPGRISVPCGNWQCDCRSRPSQVYQWMNCRWGCPTISRSQLRKERRWSESGRRSLGRGMSSSMTMKVAFIGGGQMAEAIIGGLIAGKVCGAERLWATDPVAVRCDRLKTLFGIRVGSDNRQAVSWADVVILAVKPQSMPDVLREVGGDLNRALVISIAAGETIRTISEQSQGAKRIVRAMPNTPALVRESMTALAFSSGVSEEDRLTARAIFEAVGRIIPIEERLMDAVTGLSGS